MVLYGQIDRPSQPTPPPCPKCGSLRTQIVGRLEDGTTSIVRCNACGSHATIVVGQPLATEPVFETGRTPDGKSREVRQA